LGLGFIETMPALGIGRKDFCPGRGDENASMVPQLLDGIFQIQRNRQREVFQKADSIDDSAVIGKWFLTFLSSGSKCRVWQFPQFCSTKPYKLFTFL